MCGIAAVCYRGKGPVVDTLFHMIKKMQHRGMDSSGIAFYRKTRLDQDEYLLFLRTVDVPGTMAMIATAIANAGGNIRNTINRLYKGSGYNDYVVSIKREELKDLIKGINDTGRSHVMSFGKSITIIKEVGLVEELEEIYRETFGARDKDMITTHGLGHVRFSTESRVDRHHAHPFQTGFPDIAIVHNGQITNDGVIRKRLRAKGHIFESENDTELIIHYIANKIEEGLTLEESLERSVEDLDGPFSYVISTSESIGVARDKLGLRPLMIAKGEDAVAVASEESALREIFENPKVRHLPPACVEVYNL